MKTNRAIYVLFNKEHDGIVGLFSTKEKMDKYVMKNSDLVLDIPYSKYYYHEEFLDVLEINPDDEIEYSNYLTKFDFSYWNDNIEYPHIGIDENSEFFMRPINAPCKCVIREIPKNPYSIEHNYNGYIITSEKYSKVEIGRIVRDKINQRMKERIIVVLDNEEIL